MYNIFSLRVKHTCSTFTRNFYTVTQEQGPVRIYKDFRTDNNLEIVEIKRKLRLRFVSKYRIQNIEISL